MSSELRPAERLAAARAEHAASLGAVHGLLPAEELRRIAASDAAELDGHELGLIELGAAGEVLRVNRAALELFCPGAGLAQASVAGRSFYTALAPSANSPLLRGIVDGDAPLRHLLPYSFVGPRGRFDAVVQLHREAGAGTTWVVVEPR